MTSSTDPIRDLRTFIDERWAAIQPNRYREVAEPKLRLDVTPREAQWFLDSVSTDGQDPPLYTVEDDGRVLSPRTPPNVDGGPRGNVFFEERGRLRLETIVHMGATARFRDEFGWPSEHLVVESPDVVDDAGRAILRREALDIVVLEQPCSPLPSKMTLAAARSRICVEAKADARLLNKLLEGMQACRGDGDRTHEHNKCRALEVFRPLFFLGVAASETWRLFRVDERNGRAVLAERCDLGYLQFDS